ncbi:MAG: hypothetical protein IJB10_03995 [Clostridia bacterium]|nr:hypothetical protein [Clostridia bacterium]
MKNFTKKIFSCLVALVMMFGFGSVLFACGEDPSNPEVKTSKVMNLTLNPSIELVLDKDNNVVSVSANNDEGNFILAQAQFVSLSADAAVEKFLELTKDNGFLVEGEISFSENQFKIEISGNNSSLYNQVVKNAKEYLEDTNFNVNFSFEKINKAELQSLVRKSMKDLTEIEIFRMSEEQLISKVKEIREETKDIYSQELKNLYYSLREGEILKAKFEAVKTQLDNIPEIAENIFTTFLNDLNIDLNLIAGTTNFEKFKTHLNNTIEELESQINIYKSTYEAQFINTNSYNDALNSYIEAKKDLLEARLNKEDETIIQGFEIAAEAAYDALYGNSDKQIEGALKIASDIVSVVAEELISIEESLNSAINIILTFLDQADINLQIENAKSSFYTSFTSNLGYGTEIANSKDFWNTLKPNVEVGE